MRKTLAIATLPGSPILKRAAEMAVQLAALALALVAGVAAAGLARQKGRSLRGWTIASVLLVFPAFIVALLPPRRPRAS